MIPCGYDLTFIRTARESRIHCFRHFRAKHQNPYGIAVNPQTREIYIADARDGVTPGKLYCFSKDGTLKWSTYTGELPSRIVFTKYHPL